jgi:hypothetical protein
MFHQPILGKVASSVSLPELAGAFSYALDVGKGRRPGHSVRSTWIGMHVGRERGISADESHVLYFTLLLANFRCGPGTVPAAVADGVAYIGEHWDGSGQPGQLRGADIPLASRIALLAQVADLTHGAAGRAAAISDVIRRSGSWLDPNLVDSFKKVATSGYFWAQLTGPLLDARVAMLAPPDLAGVEDEYLLTHIAADLGRIADREPLNGDCIAALRRAGVAGR